MEQYLIEFQQSADVCINCKLIKRLFVYLEIGMISETKRTLVLLVLYNFEYNRQASPFQRINFDKVMPVFMLLCLFHCDPQLIIRYPLYFYLSWSVDAEAMILILQISVWILRCLAYPRKHQKVSCCSITIRLLTFDHSPSKEYQINDPSSYFRHNLNVVVLIYGYLHIIDHHSNSICDIYQISSMLQLPAYSVDVSQPTKAHSPSILSAVPAPSYKRFQNLPVCSALLLSSYTLESFRPIPSLLKMSTPSSLLVPTSSLPVSLMLYFQSFSFLRSVTLTWQQNFSDLSLILMTIVYDRFMKVSMSALFCCSSSVEGHSSILAQQSFMAPSMTFFRLYSSFCADITAITMITMKTPMMIKMTVHESYCYTQVQVFVPFTTVQFQLQWQLLLRYLDDEEEDLEEDDEDDRDPPLCASATASSITKIKATSQRFSIFLCI